MKKWRRCFSYRWSHFLCQNNERDLKPIKEVWVSYKKELVNMGVWGELMPSGFGEKNETQRGVRELGVRLCWTRGAQEVWSSEPDPSSGLKDQSWVGTQNVTPTSVKFWQESKSCKLTGRTVSDYERAQVKASQMQGRPRPWPSASLWEQCPLLHWDGQRSSLGQGCSGCYKRIEEL